MLRHYLKQSWQLIRQNRFYTAVYILGTGLAIAMVMVMAIVYHIRTANIAPENNRDRMLIVDRGTAKKATGGQHSSRLSYQTIKACYYPLETPRVVSVATNSNALDYSIGTIYTSIPGSIDLNPSFTYATDAAFFELFNYSFIAGRAYTEEEFQSGMHYAILCESLAKKLFNSVDVLNKVVLINDVTFIVIGLVKDVSPALKHAYAELWVPFTAIPAIADYKFGNSGVVGTFSTYILANSTDDFPLIKQEIESNRKKYNTSLTDWEYVIDDRTVLTVFQTELRQLDYWANFKSLVVRYSLIAFLFMLVPAVNLSGLTSSRMQERSSEMGIRKAFGATKSALVNQMLTENLLLTLLGGIAGLAASVLVVTFASDLLFHDGWGGRKEITLSLSMLINMRVFAYTFAVCLLLNILSSYIPVWNASRRPVIQSINDN